MIITVLSDGVNAFVTCNGGVVKLTSGVTVKEILTNKTKVKRRI